MDQDVLRILTFLDLIGELVEAILLEQSQRKSLQVRKGAVLGELGDVSVGTKTKTVL